jgi:outer membrane protein TolC
MKKALKNVNKSEHAVKLEQNQLTIDQIKKEVLNQYLAILFLQERDKILNNSLELIRDNIKTLTDAKQFGVVRKTDLQQLQLKEKELISNIGANLKDIQAATQVLSTLTGLTLDESYTMLDPKTDDFSIDDQIAEDKIRVFDLQNQWLEAQEKTVDAKYKPRVFSFINAGTGYPNPLNFFDDQLSLFAVGGIGFSWNIYNWGTGKKEKQLLQLQQDLLKTEKENTETKLNKYNKRFEIGIQKYTQQIEDETEMIALKKEIANTQKSRLEEGVIIPFEYISNLNDIISSELKLNLYKLEIIKLKLEYQLLKGLL